MKIRTIRASFPLREVKALVRGDTDVDAKFADSVSGILRGVRDGGDAALLDFVRRFDGFPDASAGDLRIPMEALDGAEAGSTPNSANRSTARRTISALFTSGSASAGSSTFSPMAPCWASA